MQINDELILKLEKLSRLQLKSGEREIIKKDLSEILKMVDKLQELNTDGMEPLVYVNKEPHILRADEVANQLSHEDALKNAKNAESPFFKVPKVK